jgi:hypothetical protein
LLCRHHGALPTRPFSVRISYCFGGSFDSIARSSPPILQNDSAFSVGNFLAVVDPIDGSKNIDASLPVGNIFGIYKRPSSSITGPTTSQSTEASFLQHGGQLVAAGYCLFSYVLLSFILSLEANSHIFLSAFVLLPSAFRAVPPLSWY